MEEFAGKIKIAKVNVDSNSELASNYGVTALPTVLFFVDGKVVDQQVGFVGKEIFVNKIQPLVS